MKQLLLLMVLLVGTMSLTACSGSSNNETEGDVVNEGNSLETPINVAGVKDFKIT